MFTRVGPSKRKKPDASTSSPPVYNLPTRHADAQSMELEPTGESETKKDEIPILLETSLSDHIMIPSRRIVNCELSDVLKYSGNGRVWQMLLDTLVQKVTEPILIWGPTGCGKTCGVNECATICGLRVYEIEPSILDSTRDLETWLHNISGTKTLLGPRMILVDVIEGIDSSYIHIFQKFLKKNEKLAVPMVFIADNAYHLPLRYLFASIPTKLRCYKPNADRCAHFARLVMDSAKLMSSDRILEYANECDGDLRTLKRKIVGSFVHHKDESLSLFESTRQLLCNQLGVDKWVLCGDRASILHILSDNYATLIDDLDSLVNMSNALCSTGFEEDLFFLGLCLRVCYKRDGDFPRMTLHSHRSKNVLQPINDLNSYRLSTSRLYTPTLLVDPQTFYIVKNRT